MMAGGAGTPAGAEEVTIVTIESSDLRPLISSPLFAKL